MSITVKSRSKSLKDTVVKPQAQSVASVLEAVSQNNRQINPNRLRLTYQKENKQVPITSDHFFEELSQDTAVYVKDLGPQISWRLVFVVEYFGPILIHSLMYRLSLSDDLINRYHSSQSVYNPFLNKLAYTLVMVHYLKREFETLFVHQFSQSTMPLFNLFKNSFHYWILNGVISLGYFGYGFAVSNANLFKLYSFLRLDNLRLLLALFGISELWNFYVHVQLRRWGDAQKAKGITKRVPLEDGVFKIFVAPNYTFEVWSWIWFTAIFKLNTFSLLFVAVSTTQMYLWAMKKNKKYGTKRAFLIPFLF